MVGIPYQTTNGGNYRSDYLSVGILQYVMLSTYS